MKNAMSSDDTSGPIDALPRAAALRRMLDSHLSAAAAVSGSLPDMDAAAEAVARALAGSGNLIYAAAGSSGLMALSDASELSGTFGIAQDRVRLVMAGGVPVDARMPGETEDDSGEAAAASLGPEDVAIVVSASGTTPFACTFAEAALDRGATVIAIANVAGSRLLRGASIAIALPTDPEVVSGSTRLGAGTAQKIALNMISTQAGILLGHVHDGQMVNLVADNAKLRKRAAAIVERIARVPAESAEAALSAAGHDTKLAVLLASGKSDPEARAMLAASGGRLRDCLFRPEPFEDPRN